MDVLSLPVSDVPFLRSLLADCHTVFARRTQLTSPVQQEQGVVGKPRVLSHCHHRAPRGSLLVLVVDDECPNDIKSLQADNMPEVWCWML